MTETRLLRNAVMLAEHRNQDLEAMNLIPHQAFFFCRRGL
jgi:hypothetical protein